MRSYIFEFQDLKSNTLTASPDIEVKLKCSDILLDITLDTNELPHTIPRFKEETYIDIKFTPVSQMTEETHYKANKKVEDFHESCWYKSRVNVSITTKPLKYTSTCYLVPKADSCISEVEFWMSGTQRRMSSKEDYFHRKVSEEEMAMLEQLGVI